MKKTAIIVIAVILVMFATSCTKSTPANPSDFGKAYVRIQEVDNDGSTTHSIIVTTYINK